MSAFESERKKYTEEDYYNLPENIRAELIDGQFYNMASPSRVHQEIVQFCSYEIGHYIRSKDGGCRVYTAPFAVTLFQDKTNIVEPDISVICDKNKLTDKGCSGAPDWIIEVVSPGNPSHDYVFKLNMYLSAGVREYWIINPMTESVHVYFFEDEPFDIKHYTFQDKVKANIFGDLYLDFLNLNMSE